MTALSNTVKRSQGFVGDVDNEVYQLALEGLIIKVDAHVITQTEYDSICVAQCLVGDVVEAATRLGYERRERRRHFHQVLDCFQKMVAPLNRYSEGIDSMVQTNPMACLAWGALKAILLAAHDFQEDFEVIVEGLQLITDSLPNHQAYHTIAITEPKNPLRPPIVRIYVETLIFSILATRYLHSGLLKTTGRALLRSESHGFRKCIDEIKMQSTHINSLAIGDIWHNSNATIEELRGAVKLLTNVYLTQQQSHGASRSSSSAGSVQSNIPGLLSSNFVAREQDIRWIASVFESDVTTKGTRRAAVYGMTGVGKSQLILKYEERYRDQYAFRFWITSGSYEKVRVGVQRILDILDLPERLRSEPHVQDKSIRSWLEKTANWLLVFDNVTEEDYKAILELLPQGAPNGDILFTSQRPGAMDRLTGNLKTRCLRLEELSSDDSVDLFYLAANIVRTADNEHDAKEIVKSNGFLPQAVHQAASYIKNTETSLPDYMSQFKRNTTKLLEYKDAWDNRQAISVHMQISLESLKKNDRNALNLLKLFAFFEPESIPSMKGWKRNTEESQIKPESEQAGYFSLFSCFCSRETPSPEIPMQNLRRANSGFQESSESLHTTLSNETSLSDALSQLRDFSLIKALPQEHKFWMHDLTRFFLRQTIPREEVKNWLCLAIELLFHTFPNRDETVEEKAVVNVYLPQAESLISEARKAGIPLESYAKLIAICGTCFNNRASYAKALSMFEIVRPVYTQILGLKNTSTLSLLHRIGWCHRGLGELAVCEKLFAQTLAGRKKVLPADSLDLFVSMTDLAAVIERQGRLKEAEVLFRNCYEGQKLALGSSNQRTLAAAHNLALAYANQGRLGPGELLCRKTLETSKERYGDDDPGTLRTASNLAVFIDHNGRIDEASPVYEKSLAGYKRRYGYNNVLTMRIRSNLAGVWRLQGKFKAAEFTLREVLSELLRLLGPDDFHVCIANFDLAELLHEWGKVEEAQQRYTLAISVLEFVDNKHPLLFRVLDGLSILCRETGNLVKADTVSQRAFDENMSLLWWDDPYTLMTANGRAEVLGRLGGHDEEAQRLLEKSMTSYIGLVGPKHPHIFMTKNSLGCLELRRRNLDRAILHFEAAEAGFSTTVGAHHASTLVVQMNIGRVHLEHGHIDLAATSFQMARNRFIVALGSGHPHVAVAEFYLGIIAARQGTLFLQEAKDLYVCSMNLYKQTLGNTHPNYVVAAIEYLNVLAAADADEGEYAEYLAAVNETMPSLHEIGCMLSRRKVMEWEHFKNGQFAQSWSASEGLFWGESARLR